MRRYLAFRQMDQENLTKIGNGPGTGQVTSDEAAS